MYRLCDGCVERELAFCFDRYDGAFDLHDIVRCESSRAMRWNAEIQAYRRGFNRAATRLR